MSLDRLLGSWVFSMNHSLMSEPVGGRLRYERVLDGAFLMLHWSYNHPDFPDAVALLDEHSYHYFDVRGVIRIFDFGIDESGWSMSRLDGEFSQRTAGRFRGPDAMECMGEYSRDLGVTWHQDFTMTCTRGL